MQAEATLNTSCSTNAIRGRLCVERELVVAGRLIWMNEAGAGFGQCLGLRTAAEPAAGVRSTGNGLLIID